jgi:hypothetical protein
MTRAKVTKTAPAALVAVPPGKSRGNQRWMSQPASAAPAKSRGGQGMVFGLSTIKMPPWLWKLAFSGCSA